jgi:hypothetical protein
MHQARCRRQGAPRAHRHDRRKDRFMRASVGAEVRRRRSGESEMSSKEIVRAKSQRRRQPLARSRSGSRSISVVCHYGAHSGPELMAHFLDHYYRLGVERFLVVVHGTPGDGRTDAVLRELHRYRIEPVLSVTSYSSALMHARFDAVVRTYCHRDDWVVYADGDELQVYPSRLHDYADELGRRGLDYATGAFVDHVTSDGALAPIRSDASLWEQFPCVAHVTRDITRGWVRKVCIARAHRKLGDGGPHTLAIGADAGERWRLTHSGPWSEPSIEIHHFKWDATLRQRLSDKLNGAAGDRDRIDGAGFMDEYRRLADHLEETGGRVALEAAHRADLPRLAFERSALGPLERAALEPLALRKLASPELLATGELRARLATRVPRPGWQARVISRW